MSRPDLSALRLTLFDGWGGREKTTRRSLVHLSDVGVEELKEILQGFDQSGQVFHWTHDTLRPVQRCVRVNPTRPLTKGVCSCSDSM